MKRFDSQPTLNELAELAIEAAEKAYSPYSGFCVGAALLCANGNVYQGCNIENSSYSATVCAERVAFQNAVSNGEKGFVSITIVGSKDGKYETPCYPCGVCRQVMSEFCLQEDFQVILPYNKNKELKFEIYQLSELLPRSFSL